MTETTIDKTFQPLPRPYTDRGTLRGVGFELEYAGPRLEAVAELIKSIYGGEVTAESTFVYKVKDTRYGDFSVEIDTSILKEKKYEGPLRKLGLPNRKIRAAGFENSLMGVFSRLVPFEVSTPPIPCTQLSGIEELRAGLRSMGARGTRASIRYAFGLHINTEMPDDSAGTLLDILRSFLLLYPWIERRVDVDIARRLSPYITGFASDFARHVLRPDYRPDKETLILDYLRFNPTRNRPLDMLPLFSMSHEDLVRGATLEPHLTKKRPAFHYRMPNCLVDEPDWAIAREWNTWVAVERLAGDRPRLLQMMRDYLRADGHSLRPFYSEWPHVLQTYLVP